MKIYAVGGAVRDELLGFPVKERDYVVVGATPEQMVRLGFRPVGKDFPVFLHPQTHEEYALARTERKVARGYRGFRIHASPEVTLEQDLARRDLTINAMARDADGRLIDPFGGKADLERRLLRHVSPAFAEDPVRILRVARFAARFGFEVAEETMALMRAMVEGGEADALVPERVWREFSRGLIEREPMRMFRVLAECGLLAKLMPELALGFERGEPANEATGRLGRALACAADCALGLPERFTLVLSLSTGGARAIAARLRAPGECRDLALLAERYGEAIQAAPRASPEELLALLERCDALRRRGRLEALLSVFACRVRGERGWVEIPYPPRLALRRALAAATAVDAARIAARGSRERIAERVRRARIAAIAAAIG